MKIYKGYDKGWEWALGYILENHIKCRYYGWVETDGDIDLIKIDGKIWKFNTKTYKEIKD